MNWLDFQIDLTNSNIKFYKKSRSSHGSLALFNFSMLIFDFWWGIHGSRLNMIGFGAMTICFIWSIFYFIDAISDVSTEKCRLQYLKALKDNNSLTTT